MVWNVRVVVRRGRVRVTRCEGHIVCVVHGNNTPHSPINTNIIDLCMICHLTCQCSPEQCIIDQFGAIRLKQFRNRDRMHAF